MDNLSLRVQTMAAQVPAGGTARYAIRVSLAGKANGTAKIHITAEPGGLAPRFTVCPSSAGAVACSVVLPADRPIELRAAVAIPKNAASTRITVTAAGTSPQAAASASASASVLVTADPTPAASKPGTAPAPAGVGVALPPGTLPTVVFVPGAFALGALPVLPGPVANPGLTFPKISPSPDASRSRSPVLVAHEAASLPQGTSPVGGQEIGLLLLATALLITVTRLAVRRRRRQHGRGTN